MSFKIQGGQIHKGIATVTGPTELELGVVASENTSLYHK